MRRLAAYALAILGVFPAIFAVKFLNVFQLYPAALLACGAAACWVAAFKIDRRKPTP